LVNFAPSAQVAIPPPSETGRLVQTEMSPLPLSIPDPPER
jgi:hypothetical protein